MESASEDDNDDASSICPSDHAESMLMVENDVRHEEEPSQLTTQSADTDKIEDDDLFSEEISIPQKAKASNVVRSKNKIKSTKISEITGRQKRHQKKDDLDVIRK